MPAAKPIAPKITGTASDERFAYYLLKLRAAGDTVVVGADYEDSAATGVGGDGSDNTSTNAGAAYVFVRSGTPTDFAFEEAHFTDYRIDRLGFTPTITQGAFMTRNGGGAAQFVLPSGVVLHTLRDDFLPVPGFVGSLGWAGEDSPEPRSSYRTSVWPVESSRSQ